MKYYKCECENCKKMPEGRYCPHCGWCKGFPEGKDRPQKDDWKKYTFPKEWVY